jgi:hypothetical protein
VEALRPFQPEELRLFCGAGNDRFLVAQKQRCARDQLPTPFGQCAIAFQDEAYGFGRPAQNQTGTGPDNLETWSGRDGSRLPRVDLRYENFPFRRQTFEIRLESVPDGKVRGPGSANDYEQFVRSQGNDGRFFILVSADQRGVVQRLAIRTELRQKNVAPWSIVLL